MTRERVDNYWIRDNPKSKFQNRQFRAREQKMFRIINKTQRYN